MKRAQRSRSSSPPITSPKVVVGSGIARHHRVLLYTTCYNVLDGVTLTVRKLEQEILAAGHSVCILSAISGDPINTNLVPEHPNRQVLFLDNSAPIPFVRDPNNHDLTYQIGFSLSPNIIREINAYEPTIVHLTCPDCAALHLTQYARQREIPILGTYHSNIPEYMEHYPGLSWLKHILASFLRHQYNFLQALYVPTPYIQNYLCEQYKMDYVTNVQVWGHGVDIDKFHPSKRNSKFRMRYGIYDENTVIVLWVSRLVPEKRPDIFANVVRRLAARGCNFHALVVGAGQAEHEIKQLPNTTFCGWMNEDQLSVAYASSDVFLFPSSVETFGLVTLEAAASGLPVVVEEGCSGHLVRHGVSGYSCPEADEDAFYNATYELVSDHEMRKRFSQAGRQLSLQWEKRTIIRGMLDNYSRVTDEFYTEYGGRHANRDFVYCHNPDSFVGGNHPRPLLLILVEWLFISLFNSIFTLTGVFVYLQQALLARTTKIASTTMSSWSRGPAAEPGHEEANSLTPSPSGSVVVVKRDNPPTVAGKATSNSTARTSVVDFMDLTTLENEDAVEDGSAVISHDETGSTGDMTTSTVTTANEETASGIVHAFPQSPPPSPDECSTPISIRVSHGLAKCFARSMEFQCRVESNIRNFCNSVICRRGNTMFIKSATVKRKNSSALMVTNKLFKKQQHLLGGMLRLRTCNSSGELSRFGDEECSTLVLPPEEHNHLRRKHSARMVDV